MKDDISTKIKKKAYESGYDLCGIIEAKPFNEFNDHIKIRVEKFPKSTYLYESLYSLGEPLEKANWAKSIIVCIRRYNKYKIPQSLDKLFGKVYLFDGRLNYSKEYVEKNLFEDYLKEQGMKTYRDGVTARWAAVKAGLGHFRKNNFIYTEFGSYVWIDTWMVDVEMEYDKEYDKVIKDCPEKCNKCIESCPTKALSEDFTMDRGSCIAQLSFFSTDLPSEEIREKMGTWVYGCDVCQDVCPMNINRWSEEEEFPELNEISEIISLEKIFTMDENTLMNVLKPRFWYISEDRIWLWKCNTLRAMANTGDNKYSKLIKDACNDNNDKVRKMALWALKKFDTYKFNK
ncbi:MAG: epoxyqueuosine reductase [Clostridiaceae bacterium]|nr:epoxyqueuosine reductase [Clostridiaceae bacterium]